MEWLSTVFLTVQVLSSLSIIVLVLLQQGKGADMGSAFGSGSAGSLFGASGAANFLSRTTKWVAVLFFASTGGLAWVSHHPASRQVQQPDAGVMQNYSDPSVPSVPGATPAGAGEAAVPSVPAPSATPSAVPAAPQAPVAPEAPAASATPAVPAETPPAPTGEAGGKPAANP